MLKRKREGLFKKILGYHRMLIPRSYCEQFLNLCMRYGFFYYDILIDKEQSQVYIDIPLSQRKNVVSACHAWQIRISDGRSYGLPVRIWSCRKRWGLIAGACVSIAIFCLAQGVVWRIDVAGNKRLSKEEIVETLNQNGLSVGNIIKKLDANSLEQRVMINDDDIAWISINIVGTVARVEVIERIDTDIKEKEANPANLVSRFDAQIVSIEVYTGFTCIKEGDFVRSGDLLASGIYESEKAPLRYTRASGSVYGRITQTFEIEIPLVQSQKALTGKKVSKKTLIFFGKPIKFFTNYRNLPITYDIMNYVYTFNPFSLGELPISLSVDEYYEYEMVEIEISEEEAMEQAYEVLYQKINAKLPQAQILKKTLQGEIVDGKYVLKCTVTAICNIAKQVEFEVR